MRGSETLARRTGRRSELAQIDVLLYLVENGAARSALELSQAIYGEGATELRVQQDLMRLVSSNEIERRGAGSLTEPRCCATERTAKIHPTEPFWARARQRQRWGMRISSRGQG